MGDKKKKQTILGWIASWIFEDVSDEDNGKRSELSKEERDALSPYERTGKEPSAIPENVRIVLFEPRNFDEAEEIGHHIKLNKACCVNLHRIPSEYRQRVMDFLSGVVYGVDGSIKKIGENVILCSPQNMQITGAIDLDS